MGLVSNRFAKQSKPIASRIRPNHYMIYTFSGLGINVSLFFFFFFFFFVSIFSRARSHLFSSRRINLTTVYFSGAAAAEIMLSGDIPPNQTIYIRNINEKIKKEELRRSLYALFSQYGRILDVVALKTAKLRGQAWVVFSEVTAASSAVRQMQSFPFYDKPMRIQYAKTKSDCVAKEDGTFIPREKKKKQEEKADRKRKAEESQQAGGAANGPSAQNNGTPSASFRQGKPGDQESNAAPNSILFIQNLPHETTSMMLQMLFQQYPGFREVRMIDAKPGIAFVEFEYEGQSTDAMQALQGFKITPQNPMAISYAKK